MPKKAVVWLGSSLADVRSFPDTARQRVGRALDMVQDGLDPPDWKSMPSVGIGVREIRVRMGQPVRDHRTLTTNTSLHEVHIASHQDERLR